MRTHSLAKSQIGAFATGLGLGLILAFPAAGDGLPPTIIFFAPGLGLGLYAVPTLIGVVVLRVLAGWLGRYEKLTIFTGVVALAVVFGLSYLHSATTWLSDRGEIHGMIIGGGAFPDINGQLPVLGSLAVWFALMVWLALAWKRTRAVQSPPLDPAEAELVSRRVTTGAFLVAGTAFLLLAAFYHHRREWSSPQRVLERQSAVLADKNASLGARAEALATIEGFDVPGVTEILRREVREDTGNNQINAALRLLGRDDMLALSVLEQPLMHGGELPALRTPTISYGGGRMGMALEFVRDPAAIPVLVRLLAVPEVETRRGAASGLRNCLKLEEDGDDWKPTWPDSVDLPKVKAALVKALDDPDNLVRYYAVGALMEACGNPHYPSTGKFELEEQAYLAEWKKRGSEPTNSP